MIFEFEEEDENTGQNQQDPQAKQLEEQLPTGRPQEDPPVFSIGGEESAGHLNGHGSRDNSDLSAAVERSLVFNATSDLTSNLKVSEKEVLPSIRSKLRLGGRPTSKKRAVKSPNAFPPVAVKYHTHQITKDYSISEEIIGTGLSGNVIAVYNKLSGRKCALKILRDGRIARREVEMHWLTSGHENVVSILDLYENSFYGIPSLLMVLEVLEGGDLSTRFLKGGSKPYPEKEVLEIIRQIGNALMYLHDRNIAHRDIKMENIFCNETGEDCIYKLGDFGFAKRPKMTVLMRTPCYTSIYAPPEILAGQPYDKSCDLWSLGVTMYILLSGYPPFFSMSEADLSPGLKARIIKGSYELPPKEWDKISEESKEIINCLLRKNPNERLSIHELTDALYVIKQTSETASKMKSSQPIPIKGSNC